MAKTNEGEFRNYLLFALKTIMDRGGQMEVSNSRKTENTLLSILRAKAQSERYVEGEKTKTLSRTTVYSYYNAIMAFFETFEEDKIYPFGIAFDGNYELATGKKRLQYILRLKDIEYLEQLVLVESQYLTQNQKDELLERLGQLKESYGGQKNNGIPTIFYPEPRGNLKRITELASLLSVCIKEKTLIELSFPKPDFRDLGPIEYPDRIEWPEGVILPLAILCQNNDFYLVCSLLNEGPIGTKCTFEEEYIVALADIEELTRSPLLDELEAISDAKERHKCIRMLNEAIDETIADFFAPTAVGLDKLLRYYPRLETGCLRIEVPQTWTITTKNYSPDHYFLLKRLESDYGLIVVEGDCESRYQIKENDSSDRLEYLITLEGMRSQFLEAKRSLSQYFNFDLD